MPSSRRASRTCSVRSEGVFGFRYSSRLTGQPTTFRTGRNNRADRGLLRCGVPVVLHRQTPPRGSTRGFDHTDQVTVTYRSFQLDPSSPDTSQLGLDDMLAHKYGRSIEQGRAMNDHVSTIAASVGLLSRWTSHGRRTPFRCRPCEVQRERSPTLAAMVLTWSFMALP